MIDTQMLRSVMDKKHLSITKLGTLSGVSKSIISEILNGKRSEMTVSTLVKLSRTLDIDINLLIK